MSTKISTPNYERPYFRPLLHPPPPLPPPPPPPPPPATAGHKPHTFNLNNDVSPSVLLIIIILALIFFISGLLHLVIRYLMRPINRDPDEFDENASVLQGQLQQLFHLHDSGVDQSFIDTLPVFSYKSIVGVKDPFDCAVCLCEFEGDDKLRLLPKCSHAFHMECIDTWLLSHSTCPLCRCGLVCDQFGQGSCLNPVVLVLESGRSGEIGRDHGGSFGHGSINGSSRVNSHNSLFNVEEFEFGKGDLGKDEESCKEKVEKVVSVKLGKFKSVGDGGGDSGDDGEGSGERTNIDGRRCFSMGSFEYVMSENSSLQVPIRSQVKKHAGKKSSLHITSSHRQAMSECGGDSRRDFKGVDVFAGGGGGDGVIGKSKRESFSISKIWVRGQKEKTAPMLAANDAPPTRGSFSFRFPVLWNESKANRRANSELGIGRWEDDEEIQICEWLEASNPPSLARRSLLWVMGRQHIKEVHSSSSTNV